MSDPTSPSAGASGMSIASAVCGGLSIASTAAGFCCGPLFCLSVPLAIAGVATGYMSRSAVQAGTASEASGTPALAGMVCGGLAMLGQAGIVLIGVLAGGLSFLAGLLGNM